MDRSAYYYKNRRTDLGHGEEVAVAHEELDGALLRSVRPRHHICAAQQSATTKIDGRTSKIDIRTSEIDGRTSTTLLLRK